MESLFEHQSSFVEYKIDDFLGVGTSGIIKPLNTKKMHISPSKYKMGFKTISDKEHEFHVFKLSPPIEVIVHEFYRTRATMRGFGFDENALYQTMNEIGTGLNFFPDNAIDPTFKERLRELYDQELVTYRECTSIASRFNTTQENAWGHVQYAYFLITHKGYATDKAVKQAKSQYKLRLDN